MKKFSLLTMLLMSLYLLVACNQNDEPQETTNEESDEKLTIFTTVYPLSYFTERIGDDYVNVSSIYPPGANAHQYEPTQKDMMELAEADLFFHIGLGLEGFVENAEKTLANENVKFVATAETIPEDQLHTKTDEEDADHAEHAEEASTEDDHAHEEDEDGHDHGDIDPHVWISPVLSQKLALAIKDELVKALPEHEETFTQNYEQLVSELQSLDEEFATMAKEAKNKTFFVSHEAFGYIANAYGLKQVGIAGLNSQDEPSQKELAELVDLAKELNIQYILFEPNVSSNVSSVIQKEIGAEALTLHNLSVLTEEDIENNETYFTLMEKNIETLKKALN